MAIGFTDDQNYKDIGSAIRTKLGVNTLYAPDEMSAAILSIPTGGGSTLETKTVTPTETKTTYTPSSGYDGFSSFTVNAISDIYVGSNVTRRSSTDLSVSGATITAPDGYYGSSVSKSVQSGSATGPDSVSSTGASLSTGANTLTLTKTGVSTTPTVSVGYVSSATSSTATVSLTASVTTKGTTTITPTTTNQTITSGTYITGTQTILGDANLLAGNIKKDVSIFGVIGSYEGSAGSTDLIVIVSWDDNTSKWTPNKTFSEIQTAYNEGYEIVVITDITGDDMTAYGVYSASVFEYYVDYTTDTYERVHDVYDLTSSGLTLSLRDTYILPNFQSVTKSYDPTESTQTETVTYNSSSYNGLQQVSITVNAVSSSYVGSGITRRDSTSLTTSGATITAPAGYYASSASASVSSMTLPTSASSSATSGYTSKATIGRSTSNQYINIPTGYNSSGAYYLISATPNGSVTAPSTISGTSATVSTGTNTLTLSKSVSVTPNVTTAGYISSGTAGSSTVSLTASITTLGATTYNTSSSNQTISSGTYLTGTQTIRAVTTTNITAANIKSGTTVQVGDSADSDRVLSVTGTFTSDANATSSNIEDGYIAYVNGVKVTGDMVINKYYTGSSAPSSSLGSNGDIYLQT